MKCRYCSGIYGVTERTCGGCGAPKTAVETFLDVPAEPGHWSHSMMETVQRVAIVSGAVGLGAILLSLIGLNKLGFGLAFFWMLPLAPIGLGMGAWQSSIGKPGERIRNGIIAVLMWFGIVIAMLLAIGLTLEDEDETINTVARQSCALCAPVASITEGRFYDWEIRVYR